MLLTVALLLLLAWLVSVSGVYEVGDLVHVLLLGGLLLLLLAVIKGRDVAATHAKKPPGPDIP